MHNSSLAQLILALLFGTLLGAVGMLFYAKTASVNPQTSLPATNNTIMLGHLLVAIEDHQTRRTALAKVTKTFEVLDNANPNRIPLAYQLIEANLQSELYKQAIYVNERLLQDNSQYYGKEDPRTVAAKRMLIDTLLAAGKSQKAYDLAQLTLHQSLKKLDLSPSDLAIAYYQNAQVNLACVYPRCDRSNAMKSGLESANRAIKLIEQDANHDPVLLADTLMLKNWFIRKRDAKLQIYNQALEIFDKHLGFYNERTADAYVQLGKVYLHWDQDYAQAKTNLLKGLNIFTALYSDNYSDIDSIKRILADLYLETSDFDDSIELVRQMLDIEKLGFSCTDAKCKMALVTLCKAHFYQGNIKQAKQVMNLIEQGGGSSKLPFSLAQNITALKLRIRNHNDENLRSFYDLSKQLNLNETSGVSAKNNIAVSIVSLEWLHGILLSKPNSLDQKKYHQELEKINATNASSYISAPGKTYIKHRAKKDCMKVSEQFCRNLNLM